MADVFARPSAKSGSSKCETKLHWIPGGRSEVVSHITQPMATRKKIRERIKLFCTLDLMGNNSGRVFSEMTLH